MFSLDTDGSLVLVFDGDDVLLFVLADHDGLHAVVQDLPRHAPREVVDGSLDRVVEQLRIAARLAELEVDVAAGLLAGQGAELITDGDAVEQVGMLGSPQNRSERLLAHEEDLERRPHVQRGTDQQAQVREGFAVQQMGLVEDQQQGSFGACGPFQDLFVEAFFAAAWRLAQLRDDQFQQAGRGQVTEMAVEGLAMLGLEAVEEAFEQRGLAHAALAGNQAQLAALDEVFQSGQGLLHALVLP